MLEMYILFGILYALIVTIVSDYKKKLRELNDKVSRLERIVKEVKKWELI